MAILVIDVGTSSVRASMVAPDTSVVAECSRPTLPSSPAPGLVEFDAAHLATAALDAAGEAIARSGMTPTAVGVANQRASAVVWDRATGQPVGPGLGWQDLRTVGTCLTLQADGIRLAPNQSATKLSWLLDTHDPGRTRDLCGGTIDSWLVWNLTGGDAHVTDPSNAAVTGLLDPRKAPWTDSNPWDTQITDRLDIDPAILPAVVDTSGAVATASTLDGAPPVCSIVGDQQASMVGQGIVAEGPAKITFGTGAMLDMVVDQPAHGAVRHRQGSFPIVAWRRNGAVQWAVEAIMLSAGTNVEWLRDDLGIITGVEESDAVASSCADTGGVVYVPALLGLGTPNWDHGARGTLLGLTRGTTRAHVVRAVLEGVAHRGADMVKAAEADTGRTVDSVRIDGGMSRNATFVQALATATARTVEVSPVREATTMGAALLAGLHAGMLGSWDDVAATWSPAAVVEPDSSRPAGGISRDAWNMAVEQAAGWIPELSGLDF